MLFVSLFFVHECNSPAYCNDLKKNIYILLLQFLLAVSGQYGVCYLTHIMLPVFLISVGDNADLTFFPSTVRSKIQGLSGFVPSFLLLLSIS